MPENRLNNDTKIENTLSAIKDEIQKILILMMSQELLKQ
jgi:hypothetical protein